MAPADACYPVDGGGLGRGRRGLRAEPPREVCAGPELHVRSECSRCTSTCKIIADTAANEPSFDEIVYQNHTEKHAQCTPLSVKSACSQQLCSDGGAGHSPTSVRQACSSSAARSLDRSTSSASGASPCFRCSVAHTEPVVGSVVARFLPKERYFFPLPSHSIRETLAFADHLFDRCTLGLEVLLRPPPGGPPGGEGVHDSINDSIQ